MSTITTLPRANVNQEFKRAMHPMQACGLLDAQSPGDLSARRRIAEPLHETVGPALGVDDASFPGCGARP